MMREITAAHVLSEGKAQQTVTNLIGCLLTIYEPWPVSVLQNGMSSPIGPVAQL